MVASAYLEHTGETFKLGRKRPVASCPHLKLSYYLEKSLPQPPTSIDYSPLARSSLDKVYLNDRYGDCVIAAIAHCIGIFTGNAGQSPILFTDQEITTLYSAVGGYIPGRPDTDQGCNEQDALNYWQTKGAPLGQHQIAGWLSVNATDLNEIKTALYLFENIYFGVELPDSWLRVSGSGFTWDAGQSNPQNGHAFCGMSYSSKGVQISTWGLLGTITWNAILQNVVPAVGGELYTVVSPDMINKALQKAPNGFDWSALVADFDTLGGHVPPPTPIPPPGPIPPPPNPIPTPPRLFGLTFNRSLAKGSKVTFQTKVDIPAGSYDVVPSTTQHVMVDD